MMNRRIRWIFWLMTVCIVAINAFQAYWLWNTFQINRQQFANTVQDALFQVIEGDQMNNVRTLLGRHRPGAPGGDSKVVIRRFDGNPGGNARFYYRIDRDSMAAPAPDTLARRLSTFVIQEWAGKKEVDLPKIYGAYRAELKRRGIDARFLIDTMSIRPAPGSEIRLLAKTPNPRRFGKAVVTTVPVPVNPVRNLFLQAVFDAPVPYLLKRMGWLLVGSALLLLLTTGCFVFMLRTILRQKRLSDIKNDFINNMTHELKTPIATVTAAVEAMQHFGVLNDPHKSQEYLVISRNNLQRLSDLVERVLNLAVEEKQEMEFYREPVILAEMVSDLAANHRIKAAKSVIFNLHIPFGTTVQVDRVHFSNMLNNLIDNAIKYSYEKVTISFDFRQGPQGWELTVADNGIGIPKAYQTSVFDRFFRVPTGDLHQVKGFGLGLAYVRQVVEKHGGSISLASEPGNGSAFTLKF